MENMAYFEDEDIVLDYFKRNILFNIFFETFKIGTLITILNDLAKAIEILSKSHRFYSLLTKQLNKRRFRAN